MRCGKAGFVSVSEALTALQMIHSHRLTNSVSSARKLTIRLSNEELDATEMGLHLTALAVLQRPVDDFFYFVK